MNNTTKNMLWIGGTIILCVACFYIGRKTNEMIDEAKREEIELGR